MRLAHWFVFVFLSISVAGAQPQPRSESKVLLHEPIPKPGRLLKDIEDSPAFLLEPGESSEASAATDGAETAPEDEGLVYRSLGTSALDEETVYSVQETMKPDMETAKEPWLQYHAVFDPAVIPFKRNHVWDTVQEDGTLVVGDPELNPVTVSGDLLLPGRETFWGTIQVDMLPNTPIPIPSVAPTSRILNVDAAPNIPLSFHRDGADNFHVSAGDYRGRLRLNIHVDAPTVWFQRSLEKRLSMDSIPAHLVPELPAHLQRDAAVVLDTIGLNRANDFVGVLTELVTWFRGFKPGVVARTTGRTYRDLALGRRGICRHRAYAFVVTAHALGIPARYVSNEGHSFVEVFVPDGDGWLRIDLGGSAQGMNVHSGQDKSRHTVLAPDPFPTPEGFRGTYSHRSAQSSDEAEEGGDPVRGLPRDHLSGSEADTGWDSGVTGPLGSLDSKWPYAAPVLSVEADDTKRTTSIHLDAMSSRVFRGEKLRVRGRVQTATGPVVGGLVRIGFINADHTVILQVLGTVLTDAEGQFDTALTVPFSMPVGAWEIAAEFQGTEELQSVRTL